MSNDNPINPANLDPFTMWRDWFARSEQQWSHGLSEMLKDDRIVGPIGKEAQKAMLMQKMYAEVTERHLSFMNLPSRTDIEKIGERIGRLEDTLGALQAEIVQLRTAVARSGTAAGADKRPARTRKPATKD